LLFSSDKGENSHTKGLDGTAAIKPLLYDIAFDE
jgi:hypothetical protein